MKHSAKDSIEKKKAIAFFNLLIDKNKEIEENIKGWQKQMQNPKLSTYIEFIKYAKIVTKLSKERKYLRKLLEYEKE